MFSRGCETLRKENITMVTTKQDNNPFLNDEVYFSL